MACAEARRRIETAPPHVYPGEASESIGDSQLGTHDVRVPGEPRIRIVALWKIRTVR
jgi:hypothetical protein